MNCNIVSETDDERSSSAVDINSVNNDVICTAELRRSSRVPKKRIFGDEWITSKVNCVENVFRKSNTAKTTMRISTSAIRTPRNSPNIDLDEGSNRVSNAQTLFARKRRRPSLKMVILQYSCFHYLSAYWFIDDQY